MKKILLLLIFIICVLKINIQAETIYGEYYKIEDIENVNDDNFLVKTKKIYNTYTEEKIDKGYLINSEYFEKDINDYIEEKEKTNKKRGDFEYEEIINVNHKYTNKTINEITLTNIFDKTEFKEIKIFDGDKEIKFKAFNNFQPNTEALTDKNMETTYKIITKYEIVKLLFDEPINIENLRIEIYSDSNNYLDLKILGYNFNFRIYFTREKGIEKHIVNFNYANDLNIERYLIEIKKLYKYYEYVKQPTNIYLDTKTNIIIDDYKIVNEYYKQEKIILSDKLIIKNEKDTVDKFVLFASDVLFIKCNINYQINGEYMCNFKLRDISIDKKVTVDIEEKNKDTIVDVNKTEETIKEPTILPLLKQKKISKKQTLIQPKLAPKVITKKNSINKKEENKVNKKNYIIIIFIIELIFYILKRYKKFCRKRLKIKKNNL